MKTNKNLLKEISKVIELEDNSCLVDSFTISINVFINLSVEEQNNNRNLINITDLLGRKTQFKKNSLLFYLFDNGEVEKKIITE